VWNTGGAHFVALDGTLVSPSGRQLVHVQDPIPGTAPALWDYDALVNFYLDVGHWQDTYLVTR
jgi:hypothetical protein